jgi:Leucine-rich repeat (LRR) protein
MNIQDIINEVNSIQSKKEAIKEAINSKGVTSEGKLSKFADEIKRIKGFPYSDTMLVAISNAINLGLTDEEVVKGITEFTTRKAKIDLTTTSISNNEYRNNISLVPIQVYFRLESIGAYAFEKSNLKKLTAPLVKKIMPTAFQNCSELEELNLGSYEYKSGNFFMLTGCKNMKKLVVSDNSVITSSEYNKITVTSKNIEIYTYSGKKYNKSTYKFE